MATFLDPSGIQVGFPVSALQVRQLYDALTPKTTPGHGGDDYNVYINGNLTVLNGGTITGNLSADTFQGSGALLTDVVLTSFLPNLVSTTTYDAFLTAYGNTTQSLDTRITDNANGIVGFNLTSQSLDNKQKVLRTDLDTLSGSLDAVSSSIDSTITSVSASIVSTIDSVNTSLTSEITSVSASIVATIDSVSSSLDTSITDVDTRLSTVSESIDLRISSVSASLDNRITSVSASLETTIDTVSSSLAGDLTTLQGRATALEAEAAEHDVFTTGSCNTAILPVVNTSVSITGNNTQTFVAASTGVTVDATQGLANAVLATRTGVVSGNLVADSALIAGGSNCIQGNVGTSIIAGGSSNLIGGTQTGGGRAGNAAIIGAQNSKIGNCGINSNPGPNASVILGGTGHCIETSFSAPTDAIGYSAILGGQNHVINSEDVLSSVIVGGRSSTVTTPETIVLGSGLTGNVANHTFVESLNVKNSVTASGDISGSKIIADGSELTNVRYEQSFTETSAIVVLHNLDLDTPFVQVWSASGVQVVPNQVTRTNSNQLSVTFAIPTTGSVIVGR